MNVLFLDIETTPNLSYVWEHYEQTVIKHVVPWQILCVSYAWGDGPVKITTCLEGERSMLEDVWELLDKADVVIAHNGDRFDVKKINARLLFYGFKPPSGYKTVDTLKVARASFKFNQNGLGPLGEHLGIGGKMKHQGFSLWERCMQVPVDEKAWREMKKYAKQDIVLLRDLYYKLRPWAKTHPNMGVGLECPRCTSKSVQRRGLRRAGLLTYQQFVCNDCGTWSRSRMSEPTERPELV